MKIRNIIRLTLLTISSVALYGQETDTQGWFGMEVNKDFGKKLTVSAGTQRRYETNISNYFGAYHSAQIRYELIKNLYIKPSIRVANKTDGDTWRYGMEVFKRFKKSKYTFDISQQVFRNFANWGSDNDADEDVYEWRSGISNKYRFTKKLFVSAGATLFTEFKNDPLDITRLRLQAEIAYDLFKQVNLSFGLMRQYDYKKSNAIKRELWIPRLDLSVNF